MSVELKSQCRAASETFLVRYGAMSEVGRFASAEIHCELGAAVVVRSTRGDELGTVIGREQNQEASPEDAPKVLRLATAEDQRRLSELRAECEAAFGQWQARIREWRVDVELIDLEQTLDGAKLILYVLNDRGPETTKLALHAAAAGHGVIEVQPVGAEGLIHVAAGGGCGSCGHGK
jgi:cell fate regulator YaaT (PSP1 superfamily)